MKAIGRKAVFIYSGLDVILQITSVDPLEQIYYAGSDSFIPDRTLTPLVLTPRAQVKDKKGISMPSELANVAWYVGTSDEKNRVTSRIQTGDYYLDGLNLVVRKNLEVPQQIYVKAEYLDTRTKTTITIPQVVQLSISKSSEVAPAPTCSIDRPSDWSINPLRDAAIQDLAATIFKDEKAYKGAVKWNKSFNGIKSEIVEEDDFYISGQLTNSLKIDTDKLPSGVLIGCENLNDSELNNMFPTILGKRMENIIANGDFKQKSNNWSFPQATTKFDKLGYCEIKGNGINSSPYIQQYITPNEGLCYISFMYEPPTNGGTGLIRIIQEDGSITTLSTISTKEKEHISIVANLNNGYFRFNQFFSTVELAKANPFSIGNINIINLTQTFGKGNEPTKKQLDEVFKDMPYIPSPKDYAVDVIIKGKYEADVPMFVKYPDTLDISMKPLPLIPEGVEELELEVEATTSAGVLNNPAKYFDIDYYLSNDEEAGVEPIKVGSGNSVKVTREQLKERPEYYLEWDYKPRPTTLNKK